MLLHSFVFILLFLPIVVGGHALLGRIGRTWQHLWLLAASVFFYLQAPSANLPLLAGSILFNWALARTMMAAEGVRRLRLFQFGLVINLLVLFLFKYIHLFLETVVYLHGPRISFPDWGFPFGVSFFTLTQIMYLVDAYPRAPTVAGARKLFRGILEPNSLLEHSIFVCMFPYVTAGPIVKARAVVGQLREGVTRDRRLDMAARGLFLFSMGLAKKTIFGDAFAIIADGGFSKMGSYSMLEAWTFCFAALLHLYFDFSGYSDMALGCAWLLGIDIPQNFNAPLRSRSIAEFWQRWHISLSNFITEYLYTPLLRALGSPTLFTSMIATVLAMVVAALWHGPAWTFVAWGCSHGLALAAHQAWKRRGLHMPTALGWLVTMIFLVSTITFLRAPTLGFAFHMISQLLPHANLTGFSALHGLLPASPTALLRPAGVGVLCAFAFGSSLDYAKRFTPSPRYALACAFLLVVSFFSLNSAPARQFIYASF